MSDYAKAHGFQRIRLDVINTNPRAQQLYERRGYKVVKTENYSLLGCLLGFTGSRTMELQLS